MTPSLLPDRPEIYFTVAALCRRSIFGLQAPHASAMPIAGGDLLGFT
jgi:hypothetical protein